MKRLKELALALTLSLFAIGATSAQDLETSPRDSDSKLNLSVSMMHDFAGAINSSLVRAGLEYKVSPNSGLFVNYAANTAKDPYKMTMLTVGVNYLPLVAENVRVGPSIGFGYTEGMINGIASPDMGFAATIGMHSRYLLSSTGLYCGLDAEFSMARDNVSMFRVGFTIGVSLF